MRKNIEHRRPELGMGHAITLDERQELLGIEALHDAIAVPPMRIVPVTPSSRAAR